LIDLALLTLDIIRRAHLVRRRAPAKTSGAAAVRSPVAVAVWNGPFIAAATRLADRHADAVGSSAWNVQAFGWAVSH
jgi:hypothetical protein